MPYLLNLIYLTSFFLLAPWLLYKALTTGKYRRGLWPKFTGHVLPALRASPALRSLRRDGAQGCLPGDIYPRVDPQLPEDVGDMGRDGSPGQQQLGGDLRV